MKIRQSRIDDVNDICDIYDQARVFMRENGNPNQWGTGYPTRELVKQDIVRGNSYVCVEKNQIVGTFYFANEKDATYMEIYDGKWLNDKEYGVIHRIAAVGTTKGVASFCFEWCFDQCDNLKIDTHKDNVVMQKVLEKNGFIYCGKIYLANGSERIAYQKTK